MKDAPAWLVSVPVMFSMFPPLPPLADVDSVPELVTSPLTVSDDPFHRSTDLLLVMLPMVPMEPFSKNEPLLVSFPPIVSVLSCHSKYWFPELLKSPPTFSVAAPSPKICALLTRLPALIVPPNASKKPWLFSAPVVFRVDSGPRTTLPGLLRLPVTESVDPVRLIIPALE